MKELAPQTKDGSYARPTYNLKGVIGSSEFPVSSIPHSSISVIVESSINSGWLSCPELVLIHALQGPSVAQFSFAQNVSDQPL